MTREVLIILSAYTRVNSIGPSISMRGSRFDGDEEPAKKSHGRKCHGYEYIRTTRSERAATREATCSAICSRCVCIHLLRDTRNFLRITARSRAFYSARENVSRNC